MKITIKGYLIFKRFLDHKKGLEIHIDESTLGEALDVLGEKLGEEFSRLLFDVHSKKIKNSIQILLNGRNYLNLTRKMDTPLNEGDEITLLPMVTGG